MKMKSRYAHPLIYALLAGLVVPPQVLGAPLALSNEPASSSYKPPAPNVIVSVDNSSSMGSSGIAALKAALTQTFAADNVPNGSIRLGWQAMNGCWSIPSAGDCQNENVLRVFDATQRTRFNNWVNALNYATGTPSHRMLFNAGEYFKMAPGVNSPWASVPGTTQEPMLACRKSYNVFMTDGGWNRADGDHGNTAGSWWLPYDETIAKAAIGNSDGTARTLPDGTTQYDPASNPARVYGDTYGTHATPTFADLAFHYWATDLQPSMSNDVPKRIVQQGDETFTNGGQTATISEFWNPRNDPATWQHLTLYTVGFKQAAQWNTTTATPKFGSDTWTGGDYAKLMLGTVNWIDPLPASLTDRIPEMWHAALNSRGKFIPAPDANALATAFQGILSGIVNAPPETAVTSLSGSSYSARSGSNSYEASYSANGSDWYGAVTAYNIAAGSAAVSTLGAWSGSVAGTPVSTATHMDSAAVSPTTRRVLSHDGTNPIVWQWASLSAQQKTDLNTLNAVVDTKGSTRLDYLRGDRTQEQKNGGSFRNRTSRHGDIVHSRLWVTGKPSAGYFDSSYATFRSDNASRTPMLYVGANDGMLHGFSAADGSEKIAYVPKGLSAKLSQLTSPNYEHKYYVDGSPFTGDVNTSGSSWKTYLAGFLGAGGKGYFVLDVTNPATLQTDSPDNVVVVDNTGTSDYDVGYIFSEPSVEASNASLTRQITKMNDGRWALIVGNGINSTNEKAVLLIQYLDGARELLKISAGAAGSNGLGTPRVIDLNGDGKADVVYAGDLNGNFWKFDLSNATATNWTVSFSGAPLFSAKDSAATAQPITAAPVWLPHPNGGVMVVLGTGRNVTTGDRTNTSTQSIYGVYDNSSVSFAGSAVSLSGGSAITDGRASLVAQSVDSNAAGTSDATGRNLWNLSSNNVAYTGDNAKRGWYLDLPVAGERVVQNLDWFDGQLIDVPSTVPTAGGSTTTETCAGAQVNSKNYLNTMSAISGAAPKSQIYAYAATGTSDPDDPKTASRIESSLRYGVKSDTEIKGVCPAGQTCEDRTRLGKTNLRPNWRQLQ